MAIEWEWVEILGDFSCRRNSVCVARAWICEDVWNWRTVGSGPVGVGTAATADEAKRVAEAYVREQLGEAE